MCRRTRSDDGGGGEYAELAFEVEQGELTKSIEVDGVTQVVA